MLAWTKECCTMLRPYKTYALLAFLLYICVVAIFHFQLHKNLGLKYAAFQEASDKKLDRALKKIEVLNRRIQDLSRIPQYRLPFYPVSHTVPTPERKLIARGRNSIPSGNLYWQTNYDYSRPRTKNCKETVDHKFYPIGRMYLYSAFYDNRNVSAPFLRIMALVPIRYHLPLYCEFKRGDNVLTTEVHYYEMCENHARSYGGYILSCPAPVLLSQLPCDVKIFTNSSKSSDQDEGIKEMTLPILASNGLEKKTKKRFALCVPPLFGDLEEKYLIQFIELNLLLGVQHLNFYTFQVSGAIQKILDYYHKKGSVTQIQWTLPISSGRVWYHGQLVTINDCLYRNMFHFDYIGFHDIDEMMVPHGQYHRWSQLIDDLEKLDEKNNVAGYVFPSAFFDIANRTRRGKEPTTYFTDELERNPIFSQVRTKCMVRPPRIFELGIHHISRTLSDTADVKRLTEEQGYLHHYRQCLTDFDPKMRCRGHTTDSQLAIFGPELKTRSQKVMDSIRKL